MILLLFHKLCLVAPTWLPTLSITDLSLRPLHGDVHELEVRIVNAGPVPYPTAHGARTGRLPPVVVTVEGGEDLAEHGTWPCAGPVGVQENGLVISAGSDYVTVLHDQGPLIEVDGDFLDDALQILAHFADTTAQYSVDVRMVEQ